jgi:hypothetical protein
LRHFAKVTFAIGFLFVAIPGCQLPLQGYVRLLQIDLYAKYLRKYDGMPEQLHRHMQFFVWKMEFLRKHGVRVDQDAMVARDVRIMTNLLYDLSLDIRPDSKFFDSEEVEYQRKVIGMLIIIIQKALESEEAHKATLYHSLTNMLDSTRASFGGLVAEKFLDQRGLQVLMRDLSGKSILKRQMLELVRKLMVADSGSCV